MALSHETPNQTLALWTAVRHLYIRTCASLPFHQVYLLRAPCKVHFAGRDPEFNLNRLHVSTHWPERFANRNTRMYR